MSSSDIKALAARDIVAIFHTSFHPTKGNLVDWSLKTSDDFNLEGVEFSTLPSGLHLVNQDIVYFTKDDHHGVCIFRRRKTTEHGHRGFRLSSLGILLAKSPRPRPWRHVPALKTLIQNIYDNIEGRGMLEMIDNDLEPARVFFETHKTRLPIGEAEDWNGWSQELDGPAAEPLEFNPTLHLPHLLRVLGPSTLTLYKHVLGRRRILIYTLPPVEAACILCRVAADMCYESQADHQSVSAEGGGHCRKLKGKCKEGIDVLGMVTLNDLDTLDHLGKRGRGWIACTTDAIFLEKPSYYDLIIDLTTSTPSKASRPILYVSRALPQQSDSRGPSHRLSIMRWTWSDVKLWNELNRLLCLESSDHGEYCDDRTKSASSWADAWRVYEDVCIICAGLWMGSWRSNSYPTRNESMTDWGNVRLEGDDDLSVSGSYIRNVGMGIEGRPETGATLSTTKPLRRSSAMSHASGKTLGVRVNTQQASSSPTMPFDDQAEQDKRRERQILTTLALLQTFHANTCFQLSQLASFLPARNPASSLRTVYLSPKDVMSFELGPLSSFDARYVEWLADEYGGGIKVEVKRGGWRDWFSIIFGI